MIYLGAFNPTDPKRPVSVSHVHHGPRTLIRITSQDGFDMFLTADSRAELVRLLRDILSSIPPPPNAINLTDLPADDLAGAYRLLVARFQQSIPDLIPLLESDYQRRSGQPLKRSPRPLTDVERLLPHKNELIDSDTPKWGAYAQAARLLGVQNAGAGYRRAKKAIEQLLKEAA